MKKDPLNYVPQNMRVLTKIASCAPDGLTKYETIDHGRNGHGARGVPWTLDYHCNTG